MPTMVQLGKAIKAVVGGSAISGAAGYGFGRAHGRAAERQDIKKQLEPLKSLLAARSEVKATKTAYIKMLTPQERAGAIKFGAMLALARAGIPPDERGDAIIKRALPSPIGAVDTTMKAILATSIIAGVPLGVAAHMIGRQVSANRKAEREQLARIKYYKDVTRQLDSGLSGIPANKVMQ